MTEAGLKIREDPMGNIFGRLEGTDPSAGAGSFQHALPSGSSFALSSAQQHFPDCYIMSLQGIGGRETEEMCMHAGAVMSGSHIDAIPLAGAYDGTLGVVGAIAALDALRRSGFKPQKPIDALMFTSEEPSRFGLGCIGRYFCSLSYLVPIACMASQDGSQPSS